MTTLEPCAPLGDSQSALATSEGATELDLARQRMAVRVGEIGLLIPWDGGREVTPVPAASRIPNTADWLRGLANVRGNLVPVVDLGAAVGVGRRAGGANFLLICGHGDDSVGLLIDGLPRAFDIGAAQPYGEHATLPAAIADSVVALYRHDQRIWLDLDPTSLFEVLARNVLAA